MIVIVYFWDEFNLFGSLFVFMFLKIGIMVVVGIINFVVIIVVMFGCNSGIFSVGCMFYILGVNG